MSRRCRWPWSRPPWPTRAGVYRPRLVLATRAADQSDFVPREPELVKEMHWKPEYIRVVRAGMHDVVMAPEGTGRKIRVAGVEMAGKTGTAEFGLREQRKRHAWMIAFAPLRRSALRGGHGGG
jgi:penicillin-binding protein 2